MRGGDCQTLSTVDLGNEILKSEIRIGRPVRERYIVRDYPVTIEDEKCQFTVPTPRHWAAAQSFDPFQARRVVSGISGKRLLSSSAQQSRMQLPPQPRATLLPRRAEGQVPSELSMALRFGGGWYTRESPR